MHLTSIPLPPLISTICQLILRVAHRIANTPQRLIHLAERTGSHQRWFAPIFGAVFGREWAEQSERSTLPQESERPVGVRTRPDDLSFQERLLLVGPERDRV